VLFAVKNYKMKKIQKLSEPERIGRFVVVKVEVEKRF